MTEHMDGLDESRSATLAESALVLVQNERTAGGHFDHWEDVTGERYHFPNQYRNRIVPGRPFVYYRGVRRNVGLGNAEYFGVGQIGRVWPDARVPESEPRRKWRWFCEIEDYRMFVSPVPAKIDGQYLESIARNQWGVAVRKLPIDAFARILDLAGLNGIGLIPSRGATPEMPNLDLVTPQALGEGEHLFVVGTGATVLPPAYKTQEAPLRRTLFFKTVGDRAEEVTLSYLRRELDAAEAHTLRWVAGAGERSGWDIEYVDATGSLIAIGVKGTQGPLFLSVELTGREWEAAYALRHRYLLCLVTGCTGTEPRVEIICDPAGLADKGELVATPTRWRIGFGRLAGG